MQTVTPFKVTITPTPNPATMKFNFGSQLVENPIEFSNAADAELSPLAAKIFGFPWTNSVFLGHDFVAVTKQDWVDWDVLAEPLANIISEHLESGQPLIVHFEGSNDESENDSAIIKQIKQILNREIRPVVAMDGGDIVFSKYDDQILYLQMKGSCVGCPSSTATLKDGIEVRMKELIPEIKEVVSV